MYSLRCNMHSNTFRVAQFLLSQLPHNPKDIEIVEVTHKCLAEAVGYSRTSIAQCVSRLYCESIIQTGHKKIEVNTLKLKDYIIRASWNGSNL